MKNACGGGQNPPSRYLLPVVLVLNVSSLVRCSGTVKSGAKSLPIGTALTWTAPTTCADGSTLAELTGFRVYYGAAPNAYSTVDVGNARPLVARQGAMPKVHGTNAFITPGSRCRSGGGH